MKAASWLIAIFIIAILSWWLLDLSGTETPFETEPQENRLAYIRDAYRENNQPKIVVDYWQSDVQVETTTSLGVDILDLSRSAKIKLPGSEQVKSFESLKDRITPGQDSRWSDTVFEIGLIDDQIVLIKPFMTP